MPTSFSISNGCSTLTSILVLLLQSNSFPSWPSHAVYCLDTPTGPFFNHSICVILVGQSNGTFSLPFHCLPMTHGIPNRPFARPLGRPFFNHFQTICFWTPGNQFYSIFLIFLYFHAVAHSAFIILGWFGLMFWKCSQHVENIWFPRLSRSMLLVTCWSH